MPSIQRRAREAAPCAVPSSPLHYVLPVGGTATCGLAAQSATRRARGFHPLGPSGAVQKAASLLGGRGEQRPGVERPKRSILEQNLAVDEHGADIGRLG